MSDRDLALSPRADALPPPGHHGPAGRTGITLAPAPALARLQIEARRPLGPDGEDNLGAAFGRPLPPVGRYADADGLTLVRLAPGRVIAEASDPDRLAALHPALAPLASLIDITDAHIRIRLDGPDVVDGLRRLVRLDLDPDAFPIGAVAMTGAHGVTVEMRRLQATTFDIGYSRSMAAGEIALLVTLLAPFGLAVTA